MEFLIIGLATFFNIAVIKIKVDKGRYGNALLDASVLAGVTYVFSGSLGALIIGTIASAAFSIFLMFSNSKNSKLEQDFNKLKAEFTAKLNKRKRRHSRL